eukprot:1150342-Pelagomonas_calceolata.AAC.4
MLSLPPAPNPAAAVKALLSLSIKEYTAAMVTMDAALVELLGDIVERFFACCHHQGPPLAFAQGVIVAKVMVDVVLMDAIFVFAKGAHCGPAHKSSRQLISWRAMHAVHCGFSCLHAAVLQKCKCASAKLKGVLSWHRMHQHVTVPSFNV